jgi:phenylalanine ammonia-lyase
VFHQTQLSYVAGAICGHPDVKVFETSTKSVILAEEAIAKYKLEKIVLGPKEGLGLVNGTAFSASAGAQALYDAECLAMLTQTTTAMTVEASEYQMRGAKFLLDIH